MVQAFSSKPSSWVVSENPMLGGLTGAMSANGGESVRASDLSGFQAGVGTDEISVQRCSLMFTWDICFETLKVRRRSTAELAKKCTI